MKSKALLALAAAVGAASPQASSTPLYKNPNVTVDERVADLLGRMTTADKAAQLVQGDLRSWADQSTGVFNASGLAWSMAGRAGTYYVYVVDDRAWDVAADGIRAGQDYLVRNTSLGIPALVQTEGIHGLLVPNATIYNSPIAQACSWNPELVGDMAAAIARESLALGVNNLFAPLGDLARELRFGRVEETFGEDAFLTGEFAYAYVKALQAEGAAAMVKHFAAFATPEQGVNTAPVHGGMRELMTTYMPSYKRAIIDAGAYSIMSSYNCYDGVPLVAHKKILTDILRNDWGYKYFVMSDAGGTDRLCNAFKMCRADPIDSEAVVSMALPAGNDVEMGGGSYNFEKIPDMVASGKLDEAVVDTAVSRLLRAKFEMGLFEKPYSGVAKDERGDYIHTAKHVALARKLDAESIVLLENHEDILPLKKDTKIALIGPMAGFMNYGDYVAAGAASTGLGVTPLQGLKAASEGIVTFAQGCERWSNDESGFPEAVAAAEDADVAVVMVGTWSRDQDELWANVNATTGEHIDTSSLSLVGAMPRLVSAVIDTGVPTVVVFVSGKPVTEPWISERAAALVQHFYPSEQGGHALADVLFGAHNPSGRLAVGVPTSVGATPVYYDHLNSARMSPDPGREYANGTLVFGTSYVLDSPLPLYEFGYGLSYTEFAYAGLGLSRESAAVGDTVTVSVDVTNMGVRDGQEVVQVYVRDVIASVVVPNIQLKGFKKVMIKAGETETVSVDLKVADLGLWDIDMKYRVEPGDFTVLVGRSSADLRVNKILTVV